MIRFSEILKPGCAQTDIAVNSKEEALIAAVDLLANCDRNLDKARLLEEVRARESLSSTGIGEGVAVPHALCDAVSQTSLAVLRLSSPVDFGSMDGVPVDLIFMMSGPRGATAHHLKVLSKLARLLHDNAFRDAARSAPDGKALAQLLLEQD